MLQQIPDMFRDTRETDLVFAPVIQAATQALEVRLNFYISLPLLTIPCFIWQRGIIIVEGVIQGRNNVTRVRVEPRSCN